jgi:hypothetical protein
MQSGGKWYMSGKRGKMIDKESWDTIPDIQYGFIITQDNKRLYTVLGDQVNIDADKISLVFRYWAVYQRDGIQYITYLEPFGMKFEPTRELMAYKIGLLSYEGCVVSNSPNKWDIYKYDFGEIDEDDTPPVNNVSLARVNELVRKGFTPEYLEYLMGSNVKLPPVDLNSLWNETNHKFIDIMEEIYKLSESYTLEDMGDLLGLRTNIVASIKQIGKFVYLNNIEC